MFKDRITKFLVTFPKITMHLVLQKYTHENTTILMNFSNKQYHIRESNLFSK